MLRKSKIETFVDKFPLGIIVNSIVLFLDIWELISMTEEVALYLLLRKIFNFFEIFKMFIWETFGISLFNLKEISTGFYCSYPCRFINGLV